MTGRPPRPVMARILSRILETEAGCWEYARDARPDDNYRQVSIGNVDGRSVARYAHRVVYEHMVGPIPPGMQLDHLCRNRTCVNPEHLEPVTAQENTRRATSLRSSCAQGHPFTEENTGIASGSGHRYCRTCKRVRALARYYATKETA